MKAIINTLRKTSSITNERLFVNREIFKFSNTQGTLWNGVKRYAH